MTFLNLQKIILPEQRTPEWYAMRNKMITASDFGAILGHNKYESYNKTLRWIIYLTIFFMIFNMASNNDSTFYNYMPLNLTMCV